MELEKYGIRHMFLICYVDSPDMFGYLCFHDEDMVDAQMKVNGHYYW